MVATQGSTFGVMDRECTKSGSLPVSDSFAQSPTFLGAVEPFSAKSSPGFQPSPPRLIGGANTLAVASSQADCPDGSKARIQLIDGISLVEERPIANIQLNSADICLQVCWQNAVGFPKTSFTVHSCINA